jgi:hypothetical protein
MIKRLKPNTMMKSLLLKTGLVCLAGLMSLSLAAQEITDSSLKKVISDSLTVYYKKQLAGRTTVKSIVADKKEKTVTVYMDENLAYMPVKEQDVTMMYNCVKHLLPDSLQRCKLEIGSEGKLLEELVPNIYRTRLPKDKTRIFANKEKHPPLVSRISQPFAIKSGLQNKHIAMWQSHGFYYEQKLDRWEWQRARIFQTVEDLYTQSYVLPYLVPMLENAGANVLLPRERDYHSTEVIVDNDGSRFRSAYTEAIGKEPWINGDGTGFAEKRKVYLHGENPFVEGTYRCSKTIKKGIESRAEWIPDMPEKGNYAVYVSYKSLPNSTEDALYTVYHLGGKTEFRVNQTMGGGTWIFLGFFTFGKGRNDACKVTLSNISAKGGRAITADAVKIGGGVGNMARMPNPTGEITENVKSSDSSTPKQVEPSLPIQYAPQTSGYPRYTEGARYWLQWAGIPDTIYSRSHGSNDYTDDYQSRGFWVNYLAGGSKVLPKQQGLHVPVDLSMAFHSDAGTTYNNDIIGTLGIYMTHHNNELFENGQSRWASRDLTNLVMDEIVNDIRYYYEPNWTRRPMWDKSYSEARVPNVPTMLLELLSHQNFADMRYGLDPRFRFTVSRSIYKGMLRFIAGQYGYNYVVQPLPVQQFSALFDSETLVDLKWKPVADPIEPTAKPSQYVIYTRIDNGDFDNGRVVNDTICKVSIDKDHIYGFKITAVNDGGESFPSEILSVCRRSNEKGVALVVNGFTRISAPYSFAAKDSIGGFVDFIDHGVPDKVQYNYIGSMYEFRRQIPWMDDDSAGFGGSNGDHETQVIAGNTFDYPFVHGVSIAAAGYSFASCSKQAVAAGDADFKHYKVVDLILGKEKETVMARGAKPAEFKAFPQALKDAISAYCQHGGNMLITGAYVGTDLWDNPRATKADRDWASNTLRFIWRNDCGAVTGRFKAVASPFDGIKGNYNYYNELNSDSYVVERPDAIEPAGKDSYTIFRYSENNLSAGVAYKGAYSTFVLGIPFEAVKPEKRNELMKGILNFFEQPVRK